MSTDAILEILRHHDNPCAVLERHAPLFAPFELGPVMHYARAHYATTPRIYTSILLAALNAACNTPCWTMTERPRDTFPLQPQTWGIAPRHGVHLILPVMQANYVRHLHVNHLHQLPQSDFFVLSLPHTYYPYSNNLPSPFHTLYARCLAAPLHTVGAHTLEETHASLFQDYYQKLHILLRIPFEHANTCIQVLHETLTGPEIFSPTPHHPAPLEPGPLARRIATQDGLSMEDLTTWAQHTVHEEDEDIPF